MAILSMPDLRENVGLFCPCCLATWVFDFSSLSDKMFWKLNGELFLSNTMKFILGTKEKMTQVFDDNGRVVPGTIINAGPVVVTQVKDSQKDKYEAVQVGFGERKARNISKAVKGHTKTTATKEGIGFRYIKEFRAEAGEAKVGDVIDASTFEEGDVVEVSAISKGKGFQGGVKRHGFKGGRRSHGQKHSEREPGSIGATGPQRVFKGTRMAGRMGSDRTTIKNLKVVKIDKENNVIFLSGAIPGHKGTLVEIRTK